MEGSRHEKAALIVASYAIGITTAFIFFNSQSETFVPDTFISTADTNTAAVINSVPAEAVAVAEKTDGFVSYVEGRLEVSLPDGVRLLSFNPEVSNLKADTNSLTQGFHYGKITYNTSTAEDFVFFCEKQSKDKDSCLGFVYEVSADRLYQVTKEGIPVSISAKSASETVWIDAGLKIGSSYSANESVPWILISENSKLDLQ
jgi:hypothetical protein